VRSPVCVFCISLNDPKGDFRKGIKRKHLIHFSEILKALQVGKRLYVIIDSTLTYNSITSTLITLIMQITRIKVVFHDLILLGYFFHLIPELLRNQLISWESGKWRPSMSKFTGYIVFLFCLMVIDGYSMWQRDSFPCET